MVPVGLLLHMITVLLWSMSTTSTFVLASEAVPLTKYSNCSSQCRDVKIPYPFGIEEGCYLDEWFQIGCVNITVNNADRLTPFLNPANLNLEVLNISVEGTVLVTYNFTFSHPRCVDQPSTCQPANLSGSPFVYSQKNKFAAMGCSGISWMRFSNGSEICGCLSICDAENIGALSQFDTLDNCNGINCCQTNIPPELTAFNYRFEALPNKTTPGTENLKYAFLVDPDSVASIALSGLRNFYIPFFLDWKLNHYSAVQIYGTDNWTADLITTNCTSTTQCFCSQGHQGNPYLIDGCQDIDECKEDPNICGPDPSVVCINYKPPEGLYGCQFPNPRQSRVNVPIVVVSCVVGFLFLHIGGWWSHKVIKKRKNIKRKQKFFKQNGGLLLQQQSSSYETVETIKLFNSEELEKATNNFDADRILGRGGQGTVYKGMLADGKIIAVKKSLLANEDEVRHFINEIVVLSQIIHRNVVKLLGCCLETEVPLLVYEFISNGTLSHYIQHENEDFPLTWEMRLRVAIEVAGALSYLHSSASAPIYHRDIKSSNILLDDKYRVKVADFGTSRSVSIDKTHLTMTQVQGTFGYLDPEYFQTSQFTDKSDVYSFGVVLAELLTGKKPIFQIKSEEAISLSNYFLVSMEENRLFDILDARVMNGGKQEIMAVANLAKRCLNLKGRKRPAMRDVAVELERLFQLQGKAYHVERTTSEVGYVRNRKTEVWDVSSTSTSVPSSMFSESSGTTGSSLDMQPLASIKTE